MKPRHLGLDQNDTIVRRRLAQKLAFLVDDTSRIVEPTDEQLRQFYDTNAERFRSEAARVLHAGFLQPGATPERRDMTPRLRWSRFRPRPGTIARPRSAIRSCSRPSFTTSMPRTVSNLFGDDFARTIFLLKPGSWAGPVKSGYGVHLVRITDLRPATLRSFRGGSAEGPGGVATSARDRDEGSLSRQAAREVWRCCRRQRRPPACRRRASEAKTQ